MAVRGTLHIGCATAVLGWTLMLASPALAQDQAEAKPQTTPSASQSGIAPAGPERPSDAAPEDLTGETQAAAGNTSPASQDIVVTGSRLRGVAPVGSPVIGVSRADIVASGQNTTADILRQLPLVSNLGANEALGSTGQDATANQSRAQGLNIHGLGTRATLTLWNGNRVVSMGGFGNFVDPSTFPTVALDRVEVVADGASAIYGSDAVAGVVNLITRRGFNGVEASARYGLAKGGYAEYNYSAIAGKAWDSGHFSASYEHSGHSLLLATKRSFVTSDQRPFGGADYRSTFCSPGNLSIAGSRTTYTLPAGSGVGLSGAQLAAGTPNRCDVQAYSTVIPEQTRDTALVSFAQHITSGIEVFADGFYTKRDFTTFNVPTTTVSVPARNPFFVSPVAGAASISVAYNFFGDLGYTHTTGNEKARQVTGGVRAALPGDFKLELTGTYGKSNDLTNNRQSANTTAIAAAAGSTNSATALNVFGSNASANGAPIGDLFTGLFVITGYNVLKSGNANVQGSLFSLPGGRVRVSVGGEYREETNEGLLTVCSQAMPINLPEFKESRNVRSFFGELYLPILSHSGIPALDSLTVSAAVRNEHYSDVGSTTNPKVGVTWVPFDGLSLRGSYGTSFHAPAIPEANFRSAGYGINVNNGYADSQSPTGVSNGISLIGGNPDLTPEKATTFTVGADLKVAALPGLRLSGTFFSIDYSSQIGDLVDPSVLQNPFYAQYVIRNPSAAQIASYLNFGGSPLPVQMGVLPSTISFIVDARRHNLGDTKEQGIDFDAGYHQHVGFGDLDFQVSGTYLTKLDVSAAPGAPVVDVKGDFNRPSTFRARGQVGLRSGDFGSQVAVNYTTSYDNNLVTPVYRIPSYTTVDLFLSYSLNKLSPSFKNTRLSVSATNILDKDPPHTNTVLGYDPQFASPIGRLIAFSLNVGF